MVIKTEFKEYKVFFKYDLIELEDGTQLYTGDTNCTIYIKSTIDKFDQVVAYGDSSCNPKDTFIKREGRKISLTRAMKQLKLNRDERVIFWKTLFPQYFRS